MFKGSKRSPWMEGLLYAESVVHSGREISVYHSQHDKGLGKYWIKSFDKWMNNTYRFPTGSDEFANGIKDYLDFIKNNS